jgi:hypothetical protein
MQSLYEYGEALPCIGLIFLNGDRFRDLDLEQSPQLREKADEQNDDKPE